MASACGCLTRRLRLVGLLDRAYYPIGPVMDGYSVKDAALVLGIPERRVWELIARGVLASSREGPEGMRVFLQPRSTPTEPPVGEPRIYRADEPESQPRPNGNGGSHEMSPFRELLTEFRSLTERYGQALLALGEARGEVASLRGRVELLEARMDLRLPGARTASTVAWEIPAYAAEEPAASAEEAEPAPEPMADEADDDLAERVEPDLQAEDVSASEAVAEPEAAVELEGMAEPETAREPEAMAEADSAGEPEAMAQPEAGGGPARALGEPSADDALSKPSVSRQRRADSRRKKIRGGRIALAGIAEALARADDPTLAELPGADEAAKAFAALQRAMADQQAQADTASPEPGGTEAEPAELEAASAASQSAQPEQVLVDQGELPEAARVESAAPEEALAHEPPDEQADEPLQDFQEEPELYATVSMSAISVPAAGLVAQEDEGNLLADEAEPAADVMEVSFEPAQPPEAMATTDEVAAPAEPEPPHELVAAPGSPYSTDVIEPDWFADGDFTWLEAAQAEAAQQAPAPEQRSEPVAASEMTSEVAADTAADVNTAAPEPALASEEPVGAPMSEPVGTASPEPMEDTSGETELEAASAAREPMAEPETTASPVEDAAAVSDVVPAAEPDRDAADAARGEVERRLDEFRPSEHEERRAEDEARAAIQDAFEEPAAPEPATDQVASEDAVASSAAIDEPEAHAEAAPAEPIEPPLEEPPQLAAGPAFPHPMPPGDAEPAEEAIQDAFSEAAPAREPADAEPAEEAIQDAFTEAAPAIEAREEDTPSPEQAARLVDVATTPGVAAGGAPAEVEQGAVPPETASPAPAESPAATPIAGREQSAKTGEEELMWLGDEFEESSLEIATRGWRSADAVQQPTNMPPPVLELSDAELSQLAEDEGWDTAEIEAIRSLLGRPTPSTASIPDAQPVTPMMATSTPDPTPLAGRDPVPAAGPNTTSPTTEATQTDQQTEQLGTDQPSADEPSPPRPAFVARHSMSSMSDPQWLKGRRGPAATAYRRLRRLFPG